MNNKKVLFIDRDGTLIIEPPEDYQVDSLEKLEFYPGVFRWLSRIQRELEYEFVMVTNQDGLGTDSFPEETFWPAHNKMLKALENEGICFTEVLIDRSFESDNSPNRKPNTGMLSKYLYGAYDLPNSFVIGDRKSDVQLAKNMGCKSILLNTYTYDQSDLFTPSWQEIYEYLKNDHRTSSITRITNETEIDIYLDLDSNKSSKINTGLAFLDHMLEQIAKHGGIEMTISCNGDLQVDEHHTIEDIALALGEAFREALGNKKAISRYGFLLPMDEALAQVAIDFGGRPHLSWEASFNREYTGDVPTDMWKHFFQSFSNAALCTLNIKCEAENDHHRIESIFKAFAKSISMAISRTNNFSIPSSKGII